MEENEYLKICLIKIKKMKFSGFEINPQAKKKILPALGGIKKNYIKKSYCLKRVLRFLSD